MNDMIEIIKDARRYRWLRDTQNLQGVRGCCADDGVKVGAIDAIFVMTDTDSATALSGAELDAAIDAQMKL